MSVPVSSFDTLIPKQKSDRLLAQGNDYFLGRAKDAILLWGLSLLVLPVLLLLDPEAHFEIVFGVTFLLAHVINHPHFAHSYQLFYRSFRTKVFGNQLPTALRWRYIVVGIAAPVAICIFFGATVWAERPDLLGYTVNLMGFLVGWHYVKQGYGVMMADCALKRQFFKEHEKHWLLCNAYAVWLLAWLQINSTISQKNYFGIAYYTFDAPEPLYWCMGAIALTTGLAAAKVTYSAWVRHGRTMPWNGLMAYIVALYIWTLMARINPLWLLVIPALHSVQYLAVVWRYEINFEKTRDNKQNRDGGYGTAKPENFRARLLIFLATGIALGYAGFWAIPEFLDAQIEYSEMIFGGSLFLFVCWIFINVHHYLIDSVIWRRENPETRRHLFG
jgi:hypothetical protein